MARGSSACTSRARIPPASIVGSACSRHATLSGPKKPTSTSPMVGARCSARDASPSRGGERPERRVRDAPRRHAARRARGAARRGPRWPANGARSSSIRSSAAAPLAREVPRHEVRQVVVADAHRVAVTERDLRDLGGRPGPDAGCRRAAARRRRRAPGRWRRSRRRACRATRGDRLGAAALDPAAVQRPVRRLGEPRRVGRQHHRAAGPGAGSAYRPDETAVGPARLDARDLLVDDRRDQRLDAPRPCRRAACPGRRRCRSRRSG